MRNLFLMGGLFLFMAMSCQKQTETSTAELEQNPQAHPVCGMEMAMAALSAESRQAMKKSLLRTDAVASELLLFLDFDGAEVRSGEPDPSGYFTSLVWGIRNCPAPSLSPVQIAEIIDLVKDDFSPFNIIITTDQTLFNSYPPANKEICIITTSPSTVGLPAGVGGSAPFYNIGTRLPYNPSFVFTETYGTNLAGIARVISHEVAHTMGLGHQSLYSDVCGFLQEYHPGFGTGPLSFSPIMGNNDKRISNWFEQSCTHPVFGVSQNDFALLNSQVALREDDFPNYPTGKGAVSESPITGILEAEADIDFIRINFQKPGPVTISSENIDLKVSLYTAGGNLLGEYENSEDTQVTIPFASGMRYLKIEASGNVNMSSQFMTGKYKISF